jgi:quinol monooxygenase YgiN
MLAVHVFVQVKPDCVERFIKAAKENAQKKPYGAGHCPL